MSERDQFRVEGVGCWCPDTYTLQRVRIEGHTKECTQARRGWEANYRNLSEIERQKRADQELGRQLRESATAALAASAVCVPEREQT